MPSWVAGTPVVMVGWVVVVVDEVVVVVGVELANADARPVVVDMVVKFDTEVDVGPKGFVVNNVAATAPPTVKIVIIAKIATDL